MLRKINPIAKLLRLQTSNNAGEAANAAAFVEKLCAKYNVSSSDCQDYDPNRDEVKFQKFIQRLRLRFSMLFDIAMERQVVLKGLLTPEEFAGIKRNIRYDFKQDNFFTELKQNEILNERVTTATNLDQFVGKYFSRDWVERNVFKMTQPQIDEMAKQIQKEIEAETEMNAALADPADGTNNIDGTQGPPNDQPPS